MYAGSAAAQSSSQQPGSQNPAKSFVQVSATAQESQGLSIIAAPEQASLGDMARLARAKKNAAPAKAAAVINDENLSRAPRDAAEMALDASFNAAPRGPGAAPSRSSDSPSSGHGKITLLDFWASWCGPCRESLPDLKRLQAAYGDRLEVISISEDHDENTWRNFVAANGMNWTQRFDTGGAEAHRYGASALPTFIVLDGNGSVLGRLVGEDPSMPLAERLAPLLAR